MFSGKLCFMIVGCFYLFYDYNLALLIVIFKLCKILCCLNFPSPIEMNFPELVLFKNNESYGAQIMNYPELAS